MESKVYRFEKNGIGVYNCIDSDDRFNRIRKKMGHAHSDNFHPNPYLDGINIMPSEYCACPSIDTFKEWFDGFIESLLSLGAEIVEYTVRSYKISISEKQCVFNKRLDVVSRKVVKLEDFIENKECKKKGF